MSAVKKMICGVCCKIEVWTDVAFGGVNSGQVAVKHFAVPRSKLAKSSSSLSCGLVKQIVMIQKGFPPAPHIVSKIPPDPG